MRPEPKKRPQIELVRRAKREIYEDPLQHLWAISYSDVLMVVMTFFVFYFSFSDKVSSSTLLQLVAQLNGREVASPAGNGGRNDGAGTRTLPDLGKQIVEKEKSLGLTQERIGDRLLIHFPDDFYRVGQYRMDKAQEAAFDRLLATLAPYREKLSATLIGHADRMPVGRPKAVINSNLVLSSLRAARAAEYLMLKGWTPEYVFAKGDGEYARGTRSLSLQLEERAQQR